MLNWITGKLKQEGAERSNHPLGSDAAIRSFLENLTPGRPETNLLEICEWLAEPANLSAALPPAAVLRAVARLDEHAQAATEACWQLFLAEQRVDHLAEQKLKALESIYQARHAANLHCLRLLEHTPDAGGTGTLLNTKALLAQRAINALVGRLRVMRIRYRVPDTAWWGAATEALQFADQAGVINLKQNTYPTDTAPSSPWLELLVALFFEVSPLGNCRPQQMELLLRILRWLEPQFMVQGTYSPQSPYYVRLDWLAPPAKTIGALAADPKLVFFGPGLAYGRLIALRATIKTSPSLPEWLLTTHCDKELALAIVDALIMHWSERPPQRRFKREQASGTLRIANGFAAMRRVIAFSEFARSGRKIGYKSHLEMLKFARKGFADAVPTGPEDEERWQNATPLETLRILETAGDKQMMDDWSLTDLSEAGLGATSPFLKPWMVIGAYVGYRPDTEIDWQIGILRRIHRRPSGHPSLGLETFSETPRCAQVRRLSVVQGNDPWQHISQEGFAPVFEDAIVLSMSKSLLLLPAGIYADGATLVLVVGGNPMPIRLTALVHRNADCDCAGYEICEGAAVL